MPGKVVTVGPRDILSDYVKTTTLKRAGKDKSNSLSTITGLNHKFASYTSLKSSEFMTKRKLTKLHSFL